MNASTPEAQALIYEQTQTFVRLCEAAAESVWKLIDNAPTPELRTRSYEVADSITKLAIDAMGKPDVSDGAKDMNTGNQT